MTNDGSPLLDDARPGRGRLRPVLLISGFGLAVSIGLGVWVFSRPHAKAASPSPPTPALAVTAVSPQRATWPLSIEAQGTIAAWQEASIGSQIGGYQLVDVLVNVGDIVKKGEVLARFNRALLEADETQLKASDEEADANRKRALALEPIGVISHQYALQLITQAKVADALLASKRLQLLYTDVVAPDDGAISSRSATLGAVVPVGQELFRLIRQNRLEWRGELTAAQIARVQPGQAIILNLPDGTAARATVRQTAPSLNAQSRLGIVYADIAPGSSARAGVYANGTVVLGQSTAIVVPAESVVIRDGRNFVLKIEGSGSSPTVSLRPVVVGRRKGDEVEAVDGVTNDDRLVVQGAGFLNDGDVVRIVATRTTASTSAPQ